MSHGPLVELITVDPRIKIDLRYATTDNFCHEVLYPINRCFVHHDVASALKRVQDRLAPLGLYLKVYDGYRPVSVQQKMWDLIQDERYVMNPAKNKGRHTRGTAVDVTLVDKNGSEVEMPSEFDDFSQRAHRDTTLCSKTARHNMKLLEEAMQAEGFAGWPLEWWHYDLKGWNDDARYPSLDIELHALKNL